MNKRRAIDRLAPSPGLVAAVAAVVVACSGGAGANTTGTGTAVARVLDWVWHIDGICELEGSDMTFNAPGDPLLSIGFNSAGTPTAVGNLSSQSEGFVSFIGHPDVPAPTVTINGNVYEVSGAFFVDTDVSVEGEVTVTCN